ncbi:MAG: energy transducer TonB [Marinilabiliales bacterium]|nr:energy transducer TonB [Marinilabiliales bacterium]
MKCLPLILTLLLPSMPLGKETKKIVRERQPPELSEVYYVLKSDTTICQGEYKAYYQKKVLVEGYYNAGKRDSLWKQYDTKGILRTLGAFSDDRRVGKWEFFDHAGNSEMIVDFATNEPVYYQTSLIDKQFRIVQNNDTLITKLDRPPLFIGGTSRLNDFLISELTAPLHKTDEKVTGVVYVSFWIEKDGKLSGFKILKGVGRACNAEALRVVRRLPEEWLPGRFQNSPVKSEYIINITFGPNLKMAY